MPRTPLPDDWAGLPDDALLDVRMADLPLTISGTIAARIAQLHQELQARGVRSEEHTSELQSH